MTNKQLENLQKAATYFNYFDKDQSGSIDRNQFVALYQDLKKYGMVDKSIDDAFVDFDINKNNSIQFNEYIDWLVRNGKIHVNE